eukprot:Sspe_Gene.78204::Locus_48913_Transcript_1_1_Confidence_1.000_Length_3101::g.78204::m.78204
MRRCVARLHAAAAERQVEERALQALGEVYADLRNSLDARKVPDQKKRIWAIFHELQKVRDAGYTPSLSTYTAALTPLARMGATKAVLSTVTRMEEEKVPLTPRVYATVMKSLAAANEFDAACKVFSTMLTLHHATQHSFATYMGVLRRMGRASEVRDVLSSMSSYRLTPSRTNYISALAAAQSVREADEHIEKIPGGLGAGVGVVMAYLTACKSLRAAEQARIVMEQVKGIYGAPLPACIWTSYVTVFKECAMYTEARELWDEARRERVTLTPALCGVFLRISHLAAQEDGDRWAVFAEEVFNAARGHDLSSPQLWGNLLALYAKVKAPRKARRLVLHMRASGVSLNPHIRRWYEEATGLKDIDAIWKLPVTPRRRPTRPPLPPEPEDFFSEVPSIISKMNGTSRAWGGRIPKGKYFDLLHTRGKPPLSGTTSEVTYD